MAFSTSTIYLYFNTIKGHFFDKLSPLYILSSIICIYHELDKKKKKSHFWK